MRGIPVALLALAGCAGSIARHEDAAGDAKCREWGSQPGQPAYVNCRAQLATGSRTKTRCCGCEMPRGARQRSKRLAHRAVARAKPESFV
jgi:hypothetical protein